MHYAIWATDKPDNLERRMEVRPSHLDYWGKQDVTVIYGGPKLDPDGNPCGSVLILDVSDSATAQGLAEADPYWTDGVFETLEVVPLRAVLGDSAD